MINTLKRILTDKTFFITLILSILSLCFGQVKSTDIDFKTIMSLSSLLIIIAIYQDLGILKFIANYIVSKCHSTRLVFLVLLLCSFFGSMLFTNDVAILTLIPIFFNISKRIPFPKIFAISLLTIYANLGSSFTPFGNPQNIYIVSFYKLSVINFLGMSIPFGLISLITLLFSVLFIKNKQIEKQSSNIISINRTKTVWLLLASIVVLLGILSVIPVIISLLISLLSGLTLSKKIFKRVDYAVILTFINFFIIVGAISRINFVNGLITSHTNNALSTFISAIVTSQLISNVPAAVLLSKFTNHVYALFLGVSVGGLGTIIASLANLLALRQYAGYSQNRSNFQFFKTFTLLNMVFLVLFIVVGIVLL
ncbi:carboxylate transporter [Leuconostoc mesenteroides]|uniref:SLC13 family permease n=1 Tax=Leuconostoc mesenteroides TaxID=1245 RepID=UPI0021A44F4F|nr:SLC13 family permease [Leuconostoc mesenteroides]MCT3038121.1 carboxylate transporter [Leuconostoc mesenteroides]